MKFGIGDPNNVANINVSSYSTIHKMPTGAKLVNELVKCLKIYKLFTGDVKISSCAYTLIYGSFVAIFPIFVAILPIFVAIFPIFVAIFLIFPHFEQRLSFVERSTFVLCSRG